MAKSTSFSVCIIEHDKHGDHLCVWNYPGVNAVLQGVCARRSSEHGENNTFFYFKFKNDWIFCMNSKKNSKIFDKLPDVQFVSICVVCKDFQPDKYQAMLTLFMDQYEKTGDPTKVLEVILSIHATGKYNKFDNQDFVTASPTAPNPAFLNTSALKELIDMLGVDVAILWNAMILKKRIVVVSDSLTDLQSLVHTLPQLVYQRLDWNICRPVANLTDPVHVEDISSVGYYVVGTLENAMSLSTDYYDVLLNLQEKRVNIAPHAMEGMRMTSVHRDVANLLVEMVDNKATNKEIVKAITNKNMTVLNNLKSCCDDMSNKVTQAVINEKTSNASTQQWLYKLAIAENLV